MRTIYANNTQTEMKSVRNIKSKQKFSPEKEKKNNKKTRKEISNSIRVFVWCFTVCIVWRSVYKYHSFVSISLAGIQIQWNYIMEINKTLVGQFRIKVLSRRFTI